MHDHDGRALPAREKGGEEVAVPGGALAAGRAGKGGGFVVRRFVGFAGAHLWSSSSCEAKVTCSGSMSISSIDRVALPFTATALAATPEPRAANPSLATGGAGATRAPGAPAPRGRRGSIFGARGGVGGGARARAEAPRASADPGRPESVVAAQPSGRRRGRERGGAAGGVHRACRARGRAASASGERRPARVRARTPLACGVLPGPPRRNREDGATDATATPRRRGGRCGSRSRREGG